MLKGDFLIKHWQSELVSLRQNLSAYNDADPECVHKIRVSIKKLRAYLRLYYLLSGNKDSKNLFEETGQLFSLLGKHRDIEIVKQKVNTIHLNSAYLPWLKRIQEGLPSIPDAISGFKGTGLDKLTKAITEATVHSANPVKEAFTIRRRLLKKVKVNLRHFRRNFHQIRKDLKNIYYLAMISFPETGFSEKKLNMLDKTLDLLGNIQDGEVSLEFIRLYQSNSPDTGMLDAVVTIKFEKRDALKKASKLIAKFLRVAG